MSNIKNIAALFVSLVILLSSGLLLSYAKNTLSPGDINGDNKITAADARNVLRASVGLEDFTVAQILAADVNNDNRITAADARTILRASVELENLDNLNNTLTVATNAAFYPFEYRDNNGDIVGLDIDIIKEIAKRLGITIEIKDVAFDEIFTGTQNGQFDIGIAAITDTAKIPNNICFSVPYASENQVVIVNKSSGIKELDELRIDGTMKYGVEKNSTGDIYASSAVSDGGFGEKNVIRYEKSSYAISAMQHGKIDAVITDRITAEYYASEFNDIHIIDKIWLADKYCIIISKENKKLLSEINSAISEMKSDGTLKTIISKNNIALE